MSHTRVLARMAPARHWVHHLEVVAQRHGCTYEACRSCDTRRIVVSPGAIPDAYWLRTGRFAVDDAATLFELGEEMGVRV